jgi:hypothetical protein
MGVEILSNRTKQRRRYRIRRMRRETSANTRPAAGHDRVKFLPGLPDTILGSGLVEADQLVEHMRRDSGHPKQRRRQERVADIAKRDRAGRTCLRHRGKGGVVHGRRHRIEAVPAERDKRADPVIESIGRRNPPFHPGQFDVSVRVYQAREDGSPGGGCRGHGGGLWSLAAAEIKNPSLAHEDPSVANRRPGDWQHPRRAVQQRHQWLVRRAFFSAALRAA